MGQKHLGWALQRAAGDSLPSAPEGYWHGTAGFPCCAQVSGQFGGPCRANVVIPKALATRGGFSHTDSLEIAGLALKPGSSLGIRWRHSGLRGVGGLGALSKVLAAAVRARDQMRGFGLWAYCTVNVGLSSSAWRKSASLDPRGSVKEKWGACRTHSLRFCRSSRVAAQGISNDCVSLWNTASLFVAAATTSSASSSSSSSRSSRSHSRSPRASWLAVISAGSQKQVRKAPHPRGNLWACPSQRSF